MGKRSLDVDDGGGAEPVWVSGVLGDEAAGCDEDGAVTELADGGEETVIVVVVVADEGVEPLDAGTEGATTVEVTDGSGVATIEVEGLVDGEAMTELLS